MNASRLRRSALLLLCVMALTACVERKQTGAINPDGSGKVMVEMTVAVPVTPGGPPLDVYGKQIATQLIARAQGAEAWKDISVKGTSDNRARITATAYFPDINNFRIDAPFMTSFAKNPDGTYTFSMRKEEAATQPPPPANLTDEQLAQAIVKARADYKQQQPQMQVFLNNLKIDITYTLPGVITGTNVFTKVPGSRDTITLSLEGKQVLAAMDRVMADDKLLGDAIKSGNSPAQADALLSEAIFGQKGPITATVAAPLRQQFDYAAEVTPIKAKQAEIFQKAGIDTSRLPANWSASGATQPATKPAP